MAAVIQDSLTLRPRESWPGLDRWKSAPSLGIAAISENTELHETLRRFSAPAVVDEQQAKDTDKHISAALIAYTDTTSALNKYLKRSEYDEILRGSPEELHKVAIHISEQVGTKNKSGSFADVIHHYSTCFDILAQINTDFGCLIWGLLKFVLIVARNHQSLLQKLSKMLFKIGMNLPRIMVYRQLLPSQRMLELISQLYAAVVQFLRSTAIYFRQKPIRRYMTALWSPFEIQFQGLTEHICELQLIIEKDASTMGLIHQVIQFNALQNQNAEISLHIRDVESNLRDMHDTHKALMFQNMRKTLFLGFEIEAGLHDELARTYKLTASPDWSRWFKVEQRYVPSVFSRSITINQALSDAPDPQHALQWIESTKTNYPDTTAVFLLWGRGMTARSGIASMLFQVMAERPHIIAKSTISVDACRQANLSQATLWSLFLHLIRELGGIMIYVTMGSVGAEEFKMVETFVELCKSWDGPPINVTLIHPMNERFPMLEDCVDLDEIYDVHPGLTCSDALHQIILLEMNIHKDLSGTVRESLWETVWREIRYSLIGIALDQSIEVLQENVNDYLMPDLSEPETDEKLHEFAGSILGWIDNEAHLNEMREQIQRHIELVDIHLAPNIKEAIRSKAIKEIRRPRIGRSSYRSFRERNPEEIAPDPKPIASEERDALWKNMKDEIRKTTFKVYCSSLPELIAEDLEAYRKGGETGTKIHKRIFGKNGRWSALFSPAKEMLDQSIVDAAAVGFEGVVNSIYESRSTA